LMRGKVDRSPVDEITALQHRRRQADQETNRLFVLRQALESEILFERHAARQKVEQGRAHPEGRGSYRRDAEAGTGSEGRTARLESEEVETIDVEVDTRKEAVEVRLRHAVRKALNVQLRIDVLRHLGQNFHFRAPERADQ